MKKKLFLLVTCFFLCSAVTAFFIYKKIDQSALEITKKEEEKNKLEEEVKKLLKQLEEQKEKNDSEENNKDNHEETDDLPWYLNWIGSTVVLVVSAIIAALTGNAEFIKKDPMSEIIVFIMLFVGLFPILLATIKYKDKGYNKRYCLLWRSYWKPLVCVVLSWALSVIIILIFDNSDNLNESDESNKKNGQDNQNAGYNSNDESGLLY